MDKTSGPLSKQELSTGKEIKERHQGRCWYRSELFIWLLRRIRSMTLFYMPLSQLSRQRHPIYKANAAAYASGDSQQRRRMGSGLRRPGGAPVSALPSVAGPQFRDSASESVITGIFKEVHSEPNAPSTIPVRQRMRSLKQERSRNSEAQDCGSMICHAQQSRR
jgi:hypothetical protein